jgi:hypothetical protein
MINPKLEKLRRYYAARLKPCGVSFLDSATEVVPAALHYLGKPSFSKNPADYGAAEALIRQDPMLLGDCVEWRLHQWVGVVGDLGIA